MPQSANTPDTSSQFPEIPHTKAIITWTVAALCVFATTLYHIGRYINGTSLEMIPRYLVLPPTAIWSGNWSTLFTGVFVHATAGNGIPWHLIFNMLYFVLLGRILEATLTPIKWLLFFMVSGIVSSGAELAFSSQNAIGASGVVYAMFGLMWAGRYVHPIWAVVASPKTFTVLIIWGLFCVAATYFGVLRVANFAHAAGLLFGLSTGWLLVARRRTFPASIIMSTLIAITVLSITWMPWSGDWNLWKAEQLYQHQSFAGAVAYYKKSLRLGEDPVEVWKMIALAEQRQGHETMAQQAANEFARAWAERQFGIAR